LTHISFLTCVIIMSASALARAHACFITHGASGGGGSGGRMVEVWSAATPTPAILQSFPVASTTRSAAGGGGSSSSSGGGGGFSSLGHIDLVVPFSRFLAFTFRDSSRLVFYSLLSQSKVGQSSLPERATAINIDAKGRYMVAVAQSGNIRIYDLSTGAMLLCARSMHDRGIRCMVLDEACNTLIVGGEDGIVSVYDFTQLIQANISGGNSGSNHGTGSALSSALRYLISDHSLSITHLHLTPSNHLLTASKDGSVRLYKIEQPLHVEGSSMDDDNDLAAASTVSANASFHSAPTPRCLFHHSFRSPVACAIVDATENYIYATCRENIHWIALYPSASNSAANPHALLGGGSAVDNSESNRGVHTWSGHQSSVISLLLPPSCSHLLSLDAEGTIKVWEAQSHLLTSPPSIGTSLRNVCRRPGCATLVGLDPMEVIQGSLGATGASGMAAAGAGAGAGAGADVATVNTWMTCNQSKVGGVSTNSTGRESGWIFPALHSQPTLPLVYLPVPLIPMQNQNQELRHVESSFARKRAIRRMRDRGMGIVGDPTLMNLQQIDYEGSNRYIKEDFELIQGTSGWSSLAASVSSRGSTLDLLQSQVEMYSGQLSEMYEMCVQKIWTDLKNPQPDDNADATPATTSQQQAQHQKQTTSSRAQRQSKR